MPDYAPSKMTEHILRHPKGWFDGHALDYSAKLSANVTFSVPAGRVVHLNSAGEFEMGVGQTDMGIFLLWASNAPAVNNPSRTAAGAFVQQPVYPAGVMTGLVATGGYQLESSEFIADQTFTVGDLLSAGTSNTVAATGGMLTNVGSGSHGDVKQFVDPVCGVVCGQHRTEYGTMVVSFWPVWLPGAYA
jgi:hypothetical protein